MNNSYRHYRQVKIMNNEKQFSPEIDSFEEIVYDGKRQVYYWNQPTDMSRWDEVDFLLSSLIDLDSNRVIRHLNPHEVIIEDLTYPQTKIKQPNSKLSRLKTSIQNTVTNLKKIARRLPLALKVAWRELRSDY